MVDLFDKELKFDVKKHKVQFLVEIREGNLEIPKDVIKRLEQFGIDFSSVLVTLEVYNGS